MKKSTLIFALTFMLSLGAQAQGVYQVGNSDFETSWTDTNEPGNGWYSFVSGGGSMAALGIGFSKGNTTKTTGRNGGSAVQIKSSSILGSKANGNLTTGKINLGSTTPSNSANYNYTSRSTSTNKCLFAGRPDSLEYYAKFTRGGTSNNGRCKAIIHGDIDYKDPYETATNEATYKIGECIVYATPSSDWTRFCGAFTYTGVEHATSYILATFTTNETPGGSSGDVFIIDDIRFIYNSGIKSIKINGVDLPGFDPNVYEYDLDEYYGEGSLKANGKSASSLVYDPYGRGTRAADPSGTTVITVEDNTANGVADVSGSYDATNFKYTLTVKGQDYSVNPSNVHTYTLQFLDPLTGIHNPSVDNPANDKQTGTYDLQGRRISEEAQKTPGIYIVNGKKILVK